MNIQHAVQDNKTHPPSREDGHILNEVKNLNSNRCQSGIRFFVPINIIGTQNDERLMLLYRFWLNVVLLLHQHFAAELITSLVILVGDLHVELIANLHNI